MYKIYTKRKKAQAIVIVYSHFFYDSIWIYFYTLLDSTKVLYTYTKWILRVQFVARIQ